MSMNLIRWEQQTVTPKHDSIQWDDGRCGALNGCEITHLGANKLRISSGYIVILGRLIEVSQTDVNCNVSTDGELNGQMFIRLDLGSDEPVEIVTEAAAVLTELTQDKNANYDNGIYELLLATYNISETTISNLSVKLPEIDSIGEEISSIEEDISELNNNLGNINVYVGDDGKLHFVDKDGADSALPFSSGIFLKPNASITTTPTRFNIDLSSKTDLLITIQYLTETAQYFQYTLNDSIWGTRVTQSFPVSGGFTTLYIDFASDKSYIDISVYHTSHDNKNVIKQIIAEKYTP